MHLVTVVAGDISALVLATRPQKAARILVMAAQADGAALSRGQGCFLAENLVRLGTLGNIGRLARMQFARAMAGDASRRPRIGFVARRLEAQRRLSCGHWRLLARRMRRLAHIGQIFVVVA